MELRHIRYFVAVAEEMHFTRAARRLGIQQPPLSTQIAQLENEMGTPLFRRLARTIELTPAGKVFLEEARKILKQIDVAKQGAQRRARGEIAQLNVGFAGATCFHPLVLAIIRDYRSRFPNIAVFPTVGTSTMLLPKVEDGEIDIAFVHALPRASDGVATEFLVQEDLVVALPSNHRLASAESVTLSALADDRFILWQRNLFPGMYERIIAFCERAGFRPLVSAETADAMSIVPLVAGGFGVSFLPRSLAEIGVQGMVSRPLAGEGLSVPVKLAFLHSSTSAAVLDFVGIARRAAGLDTQSTEVRKAYAG